jgi:virginiamycin B lyase
MWFTASNKIGRITTTGVVSEYLVPFASPNSQPASITNGPDGALWFTLFTQIGRLTTSGQFTAFALPANTYADTSIVTGPDGALWMPALNVSGSTNNNQILRLTTIGAPTAFTISQCNSTPFGGITLGPDGALWFVDKCNTAIGRITTAGVITEYPIPTWTGYLENIATGPDGALWFTDSGRGGYIGRITISGAWTEYPLSAAVASGVVAIGITAGPDGAVWFDTNSTLIGRVDMAGKMTAFSTPTDATRISLGPDRALWFQEYNVPSPKVLRAQVPARAGVFSQIAAGAGWSTLITLINNSASAVPLTVAFYGDDGTALTLPITVTQLGATQARTTNFVSQTLAAHSTMLISAGGQSQSGNSGWADVTSVGELGGYAIFRWTQQSGSFSEGTAPLSGQYSNTLTVPYDNTDVFFTGAALVNLAATAESVTATAWDDRGNQLGTETLTIPENGHVAFLFPSLISLTSGGLGQVQFQSSGGLAGLGLRFTTLGTLTSIPVM